MPGKYWPRIVIDEAKVAYEQGVPVTVIARGLDCHHQQIWRWIRKEGWVNRGFQPSELARQRMLVKGKLRVDPLCNRSLDQSIVHIFKE